MRNYIIPAVLLLFSGILQIGCGVGGKAEGASTDVEVNADGTSESSNKERVPVLVELFTSEGCSSCPPADRALALLEKEQPAPGAEVITLALHVDYWNYLGWKDPFSADLFTQRQGIYGQKFGLTSVYTPQMVVDGGFEFTGSDLGKAQKVIREAIKAKKAKVEITQADNGIKLNISGIPKHEDATVYLAIAEDNLSSQVSRGENSGKKLEHISVVRKLRTLGMIKQGEDSFINNADINTEPGWSPKNLKVVVFVQENQSRKILGAGKFSPNLN